MRVKIFVPTLIIIGVLFVLLAVAALKGYGQAPTVQKAAPAQAPPAAAKPAASAAKSEDVKALKDALSVFQLDQLAVQTARNSAAQTDPVAKKALEVLNGALAASPEVMKAEAQQETDRKALLAKIDVMRKEAKLDASWDWDFNQGKFVQTTPAVPPKK